MSNDGQKDAINEGKFINDAWHHTKSIYADYVPNIPPKKYVLTDMQFPTHHYTNKYIVAVSDSLNMALQLDYPLVLVFADEKTPGGCVDSGNGMQEESLFRRTALFKYLDPRYYPLGPLEAIYCRYVPVCKDSDLGVIPTRNVSFIACPCIKMPSSPISPEEEDLLKKKVHLVLKIAAANGHKNVVMGAWGCGAWGCDPKDVSRCIKEVADCYKVDVYFPILNKGHNYECFNNTFQ
jgi:uncharacterized protein (TIGR02452 family)